MITSFYRTILPLAVRKTIYDSFLGKLMFFLRNVRVVVRSKITWVFSWALPKTELNSIYSFMGKNGVTSYPYNYMLEYKDRKITVEKDETLNLPFVMHHDKRLYFPEHYSAEKTIKDYRALLIEQDIRAAHRYVRSYDELAGLTLLDVGAAEGIFSLDSVDFAKHIFLFECMEFWQKPLAATFTNWQHKVTIVKKYVGNTSTSDYTTLDSFLSAKDGYNDVFIKMDIEGAERMALAGASKLLAEGNNLKVAICTYHRPGDPEFIDELLRRNAFSTEFSDGFMYWSKRLSKGVIRGNK
jgi:hypothetical protein